MSGSRRRTSPPRREQPGCDGSSTSAASCRAGSRRAAARARRVRATSPAARPSSGVLLAAVPDSLALRASIVIGARSRSFRLLVRLVERMPVLTLAGVAALPHAADRRARRDRDAESLRGEPDLGRGARGRRAGRPELRRDARTDRRGDARRTSGAAAAGQHDRPSPGGWRRRSPPRSPSWCCR